MPVQNAIQFIRQVRQDEALKEKIRALDSDTNLESLVSIGTVAGFDFTVEEFQTAYKHDWTMRWHHYSSRHHYQPTTVTPRRGG